jgi:hypothetical protein
MLMKKDISAKEQGSLFWCPWEFASLLKLSLLNCFCYYLARCQNFVEVMFYFPPSSYLETKRANIWVANLICGIWLGFHWLLLGTKPIRTFSFAAFICFLCFCLLIVAWSFWGSSVCWIYSWEFSVRKATWLGTLSHSVCVYTVNKRLKELIFSMPYGDSNFAFILAYLVWRLVPCCG